MGEEKEMGRTCVDLYSGAQSRHVCPEHDFHSEVVLEVQCPLAFLGDDIDGELHVIDVHCKAEFKNVSPWWGYPIVRKQHSRLIRFFLYILKPTRVEKSYFKMVY
jgi:hypothetical protein